MKRSATSENRLQSKELELKARTNNLAPGSTTKEMEFWMDKVE